MEFILVVLIHMHFSSTGRLWREDTGLIFHIVGSFCNEIWAFRLPFKILSQPGMVAHAFNHSTPEAEAGRSR